MKKEKSYDPDLMRLFDGYVHGELSRRQFLDRAAAFATAGIPATALLSALAPDYALAAQVDPGDPGIRADYKSYSSPRGGGVMRGYFVRPADSGHRRPGVVVIHENRGLNPYIEDVARRLAIAGFIAFAPDALTPLGGYPGDDDEGRALQQQRDTLEMTEDFVAAAAFLEQHPDCTGSVGAIGFCFGGAMAMRLAVRVPTLKAAVAFYGRHPARDEAARIRVPLMLHHAELDERVNASWPGFQKVLDANDIPYVEFDYAGVDHGFHNDTTPRYDEDAAKLAWQRSVEFFKEHLG
jgi:carboxymethylenebutenolidase